MSDLGPPGALTKSPDTEPTIVPQQLFRSQVLASRKSFPDNVILRHSNRVNLFVGFIALVVAAVVGTIIFGSISKKVRVTGIVVSGGGSITVSSPAAGTLSKIYVTEGQYIRAGTTLFEVSTDRTIGAGSASDALRSRVRERVAALKEEFSAIQAAELRRIEEILIRAQGAQRELDAVTEERVLTEKRLTIALTRVERARALRDKGFYSLSQGEDEEVKILEIRARLNALERSHQQLVTSGASLAAEAKLVKMNVRTAAAQIAGKQAMLEQELVEAESRQSLRIVSFGDGTISNIAYHVGQNITTGQVLASVTPSSSRFEVHLYVPNRMIGLLRHGQAVSIRYHAFPYQQYGRHAGEIREIGNTPFAPTEIPNFLASTILGNAHLNRPQNSLPEGLFRVKVRIDPKFSDPQGSTLTLKQGMTLDADINGRQHKIWRWMLEPFRAVY